MKDEQNDVKDASKNFGQSCLQHIKNLKDRQIIHKIKNNIDFDNDDAGIVLTRIQKKQKQDELDDAIYSKVKSGIMEKMMDHFEGNSKKTRKMNQIVS